MIIASCICVDESRADEKIVYTGLPRLFNTQERRSIYWKCAMVSFATSIRCNPSAQHILYTNDNQEFLIKGVNVKAKLEELGVEIRYLPFGSFKPPKGYSTRFQNAFYKLDVLKALSEEKNAQILLLDSDCVWVRPDNYLAQVLQNNKVLLYDYYNVSSPQTKIHGITQQEMGNLYREVDPDYPQPHPVWFGGEIIGGSSEHLSQICEQLAKAFRLILAKYPEHPPKFVDGNSIFDNDEYLSSFVYNQMTIPWINATGYLRRILTALTYHTARPDDLNLTIWHLIEEKTQGFPLLYQEVTNPDSYFWRVRLSEFSSYLGQFFGLPHNLTAKRRGLLLGVAIRLVMKKVKKKMRL
jgi:hypothetical protein